MVWKAGLVLLVACSWKAALAQFPTANLDNGVLHATIYLPDQINGFYRGTRFDWSGVLASLSYQGHSYYGPWFTRVKPGVRDFVFDGQDIVAGSCSAITGPSEEFSANDGSPPGFVQAIPGHTFVKIGVGTLRKPDDQKYSPYRQYDLIDSGGWSVKQRSNSIQFTQQIIDHDSGYGYLYIKTLRLRPGRPVMVLDHALRNLGRLPIITQVYNHNFLVLDRQATGPGFTIRMPFKIESMKPIKLEFGEVDGSRISYRKELADRETFSVHMTGFGPTSRDNLIRIENPSLGAGMQITGSRPLSQIELWSIRSTIAVEPFISIHLTPGETFRWSYTYLYYTIPKS